MRTKIYFISTCFALLFLIPDISKAQQAGINLSLAIPQGEFADHVDNLGGGLSGEFMILSPKPTSPIGFGFDIGYYIYGRENRSETLYNIPEVFVRVSRTNNLVNFHLIFELGLPSGRVRPYVQGLFGGEYLYTETSVNSEANDYPFASSINYDDWGWSYGVGAGVSILLSGDPISEIGAVYLDFKGRYLLGSEATYLKEGSVAVSGQQVRYYPSESRTDLLTIHAGVRFALNFN